jgi:hypothetical protein
VHGPDQLLEPEGLADCRIGDRGRPLAEVHAPGEEGDRHLRSALAHHAGDLDPVLAAEVDVEEDERDLLLLVRDARDLLQARGLEHAVALQLEVHPAEQAYRGVVIGDDDQPLSPAVHRRRV